MTSLGGRATATPDRTPKERQTIIAQGLSSGLRAALKTRPSAAWSGRPPRLRTALREAWRPSPGPAERLGTRAVTLPVLGESLHR